MPRKRPCTKKAYATQREAETAIRAMVQRYANPVFKKAYRCAACKQWHVTGTPPYRRARRVKH